MLAKLEYFNPTGSLKDRILFRMVEAAEQRGDLKPGMTIIEGTTGNTGIATSMVAAVKGYRCVIVMPEGMSVERRKIDLAYGAELVLTPGAESDVDLVLDKVKEIMASAPGKYWKVGQFENPDNPQAHYTTTGPEIWEQTDGAVDAIVLSQGTGGTITGVARYLRERKPRSRSMPSSRPSARCWRAAPGACTRSRASATASSRPCSTSACSTASC